MKTISINKKAGRPTKYTPELCDKLKKYFSREPYKVIDVKKVSNKGNPYTVTEKIPCDFPTIQGFAADNGLTSETIYQYAHQFPEFYDALSYAHERQAQILIINTLNKSYDPRFATLAALNLKSLQWKNTIHTEDNQTKFLEGIQEQIRQIKERKQITIDNIKVIEAKAG